MLEFSVSIVGVLTMTCWIIGASFMILAVIAAFGILVEATGRLNRIRIETLRREAATRVDNQP